MNVVFLDRDGVINKEVNYLHKVEDFKYTYKCVEALSNILAADYKIIIITNQAGIAKGMFKKNDYDELTKFYVQDLSRQGIDILDVFFCPHHIDGIVPEYTMNCMCRKPKPGMLINAIAKHSVNVQSSFLVGDKLSDVEAGSAANIASLVLVRSGHQFHASASMAIPVYKNLFEFSLNLGAT